MFNKQSLKTKLLGMSSFSAATLLVVGGIGVGALAWTSSKYRTISQVNMQKILLVGRMNVDAQEILRLTLHSNLIGNPLEERERLITKAKKTRESYEGYDQRYLKLPFLPGEKPLYDELRKTWDKVNVRIDEALPFAKSLSPADQLHFGDIFRGEFKKERDALYKALKDIQKFEEDEADNSVKATEVISTQGIYATVVFVMLGFWISLAISWVLSKRLSKALSDIAHQLAEDATEVSAASRQISDSSESLSASVSEQAAAIQETSASVEELSAMVKKNSENAMSSAEVSVESDRVATHGKESVQEMMTAINEINQSNQDIVGAIETSNRTISDITKVIGEIGTKTKVINDIVFQTKLLSFNASVEAARAGEHGKGFAVVAEEVGKLAQMSGNAAKEISSMLDESIQKVNRIVDETRGQVESLVTAGKDKIEKGLKIADRCKDVLDDVVGNVGRVNIMVGEISVASKEQSQGINEINKAVGQFEQVTQQNAASAQSAASASEKLSAQSDSLREMVRNLTTVVNGQSTSVGAEVIELHSRSKTDRKAA